MIDQAKLRQELIEDEGLMGRVYLDSLGLKTVGIGHQSPTLPEVGSLVPPRQIEAWYQEDLARAMRLAELFCVSIGHPDVWEQLSDNRQRVLVNLAFNLGGNLFKFHRFQNALVAGDWERAAKEMLASLWAAQVGDRAKRLAKRMLEG